MSYGQTWTWLTFDTANVLVLYCIVGPFLHDILF